MDAGFAEASDGVGEAIATDSDDVDATIAEDSDGVGEAIATDSDDVDATIEGERRDHEPFVSSGSPLSEVAVNDRLDKFTERAKKVLVYAQDEATRFNHNYIGTPSTCCWAWCARARELPPRSSRTWASN